MTSAPAAVGTLLPGYQALLFAPTELLATQHLKTLEALADSLPLSMRPRIGLLVGGLQGKARKELREQISSGQKNIIISTQAALWVPEWGKLALVVVDEQHK
jgi:ATP-dependent DNA helicase RecG